jgi:hypothetical protein
MSHPYDNEDFAKPFVAGAPGRNRTCDTRIRNVKNDLLMTIGLY